MKKYFKLLIILAVVSVLFQGFQCSSPEFTTAKLAIQHNEWQKAKTYLEKELDKNPANEEAIMLLIDAKSRLGDIEGAVNTLFNNESKIITKEVRNEIPNTKHSLWISCYNDGVAGLQCALDPKNCKRDMLVKYFNELKDKNKDNNLGFSSIIEKIKADPDNYKQIISSNAEFIKKTDPQYETKINNIDNNKPLDLAITLFALGTRLRPHMSEFYRVLGMAYENKGDTAKSIENYEKYATSMEKELSFAQSNNLYVNINHDIAIKNIKIKPDTKVFPLNSEGDSVTIDYFNILMKKLILYSQYNKETKQLEVKGWRNDPSNDLTPFELMRPPMPFYTQPYLNLAQYYFSNKNYDKAISNLKNILILEPTNPEANSGLVMVYDIQGKKDDAFKFAEELVQKNPENKDFIMQYGNILSQLEKYNEAVTQYEKVLKLDPKYDVALRNIASAYKNIVFNIQQKQKEKSDKDPNYKPDENEWKPTLVKSCGYFEKCFETPRFNRDYDLIKDLVEIYYALGQTEKEKRMIAELEALESTLPKEKLKDYYFTLVRIYDRNRNQVKADQLKEKIDALEK